MDREKFVVRLLDAESRLLAWAEVWAQPTPQAARASCPFWPIAPTQFVIERDGVAAQVSVHWCDLDIARIGNITPRQPVHVGQIFTHIWLEPVWLTAGMTDVPLPPVTIRAKVKVGIPTAALGMRADVV